MASAGVPSPPGGRVRRLERAHAWGRRALGMLRRLATALLRRRRRPVPPRPDGGRTIAGGRRPLWRQDPAEPYAKSRRRARRARMAHELGASWPQIAATLGYSSPDSAKRAARRAGLPPGQDGNRLSAEQIEQRRRRVAELVEAGWGAKRIARELGVSIPRAQQLVRRARRG